MKYIVFRTSILDEFFDECSYGYVEVSEKFCMYIEGKMKEAIKLKEADSSFYAIKFWDGHVHWMDTLTDDLLTMMLDESDSIIVTDKEPEGQECRTEIDQISVMEDDFYFRAMVKHTSVYVESPRLYDTIKEEL